MTKGKKRFDLAQYDANERALQKRIDALDESIRSYAERDYEILHTVKLCKRVIKRSKRLTDRDREILATLELITKAISSVE